MSQVKIQRPEAVPIETFAALPLYTKFRLAFGAQMSWQIYRKVSKGSRRAWGQTARVRTAAAVPVVRL